MSSARTGFIAALFVVTSVALTVPLAAQTGPEGTPAPPGRPIGISGDTEAWPAPWTAAPLPVQALPRQARVTPMLLSLGLPGLGQLSLEQKRGWAYLGAEAVGWAFYVDRRLAGSDYRDRYRDFAWAEARLQTGTRVDGRFSYYETLTQWTRSGGFDVDAAAPGVQPETDPTTFNGSIWTRAAAIFLPGGTAVPESDPAYQNALLFYRDRAFSTEFLWDWTGNTASQAEFADLIEESDDRFRQATNVLGAILANHAISAVDAYLSARGMSSAIDLGAAPAPRWSGARWSGWLSVSLPR